MYCEQSNTVPFCIVFIIFIKVTHKNSAAELPMFGGTVATIGSAGDCIFTFCSFNCMLLYKHLQHVKSSVKEDIIATYVLILQVVIRWNATACAVQASREDDDNSPLRLTLGGPKIMECRICKCYPFWKLLKMTDLAADSGTKFFNIGAILFLKQHSAVNPSLMPVVLLFHNYFRDIPASHLSILCQFL